MPAAAPWQKILNAGITFMLCKISHHASMLILRQQAAFGLLVVVVHGVLLIMT
jgi:hypothetical protein